MKARNRFKTKKIIDICDLGVVLYGNWMRPILSILLVFTNTIFLIMYIMFFGKIIDKLACKSFKTAECGHSRIYSTIVIVLMLPLIF